MLLDLRNDMDGFMERSNGFEPSSHKDMRMDMDTETGYEAGHPAGDA